MSGDDAGCADDPRRRPDLEVVRGHPTDQEIAALLTALATISAAPLPGAGSSSRSSTGWSTRRRGLRSAVRPGPDAWRQSALP